MLLGMQRADFTCDGTSFKHHIKHSASVRAILIAMRKLQSIHWITVALVLLAPLAARAALPPTAQPPDSCEMGVNAAAKNCSNGMDQRQFFYQTDIACAQKRVGIPTYTSEMSVFNDSKCTWGPCNNSIPGIAHRTWPPGAKVEVCDLRTGVCAIAQVMDRGPNVCLMRRTIDANPALKAALRMTSGLDPATYKLLSADGVLQTAQPSGPTSVSLEAIRAANSAYNANGGAFPGMRYSAIQTPWGMGYIGTPAGGSSPYANMTSLPQLNPAQAVSQSLAQDASSTPIVAQQQPYGQSGAVRSLPVDPAAFIIVQPREVVGGKSLVVSWTSVGMDTSNSCKVIAAQQVLSQTNEGSAAVSTTSFPKGDVVFKLQCVSLGGAAFERSASAKIL